MPDDDPWTALYLSGFLTTDMTEEPVNGDLRRALRLPNNELRYVLRLVIIEWFECAAEDVRDIDAFRDGLCRGDEDAVRREMRESVRLTQMRRCHITCSCRGSVLACRAMPILPRDERAARIAGISRYSLRVMCSMWPTRSACSTSAR